MSWEWWVLLWYLSGALTIGVLIRNDWVQGNSINLRDFLLSIIWSVAGTALMLFIMYMAFKQSDTWQNIDRALDRTVIKGKQKNPDK